MAQPTHEWRPPGRRWREQDLLDLPENGSRYELIDGSLHVTPPAGPDHHELADDIRMSLRLAAPAGWRVIRETGVRIPDGNLIPDITVLKPDAPRGQLWTDPADVALVVEVESPNSRRHDRFTKPALYAEAGIPHYWRVERGDFGPVVYRYQLAKGVHYDPLGTIGPDDPVQLDEPWPMRLDPSGWPR
ncbi:MULTISPECIES: Uma2 family endonuclease [Micromonospora]|uniref:Uma2 family endonuclease n=1 Tax=Micromonospora solifontis TaxID=2487138 RepID=A0ABX9WDA3_9ACTN|nr:MULTISPECIES: Uma2 family endonuclease [Micromonospora]NES16040.1 Uma2 family endonuclease [Micromonospora sp. PPF5-17B]NES38692.1 Uma2 family endonuclease [Micromonospora solifontis]NES57392.1 Uma2 family endonuclease [Micromonospora sp. PPF5-6]RNL94006.1 Uma2 family endonuclease [Micromonospora solifontis]